MMKIHRYSPILGLSATLALSGCSLPANQSQKAQTLKVHVEHWLTGSDTQQKLDQGLTAYLPLDDAFMSIAARLHLIHKAKYSIDLQYYIWKDDSIGQMVLAELLKAADRGVKIRLLIDDQNGTQLDETLKQLSAHPNFKIKLFNPYKYRDFRVMDYAFRLKLINHRMHNKLIVADGAVAVTGGRNISREYFDASEEFQFTDMDIFFAGNSVDQANQTFLTFWNDPLSYPVTQLLGEASTADLKIRRQIYSQFETSTDGIHLKIKTAEQQVAQNLKDRPIDWEKAHFLADSPNKIRGEARDHQLISQQMISIMGKPTQHLDLVSAYFVPTYKGTDYLSSLAQQKVKVRILTNSFLANDVALVHAFYQKYRKDLLKNGVELHEFKPYIERERRTWYETMTGVIPAKGKNASSLHAKFFDVDGKVFIGSFNFDPRSAHLNTEVGLAVESHTLQKQISSALDQYLPQISYQLSLDHQGEIVWSEQKKDGTVVTYKVDPQTTKFQRFIIQTISYLPIEWMM